MCFDVPKVVRSPGCDHGHDEEARNGRDIKIDILEAYVWTSERFRVIRVFFRVPESYGNSYWTLNGHTGTERKGLKGGRNPPHGLVQIGLGGRPLVGLHTLGAPYEGRPPPPSILYIRGQGAPHRHTS